MTTSKRPYSDKLDADEQITMEEMISARIFEEVHGLTDPMGEEDCNDLGREILYNVLLKFRPDLFDKELPDGEQPESGSNQEARSDEGDRPGA